MRILLGMSGGLDSSYAALKLKEEGHSVEGAVLIMHDFTETESAREAAREVEIPLHEIDCKKMFSEIVIPNFMDEYLIARTPNPCVICNSEIKFRVLCDYATENGFDKIATGHYAKIARIEDESGTLYAIERALDSKKDQTYVLWRLPQDVLGMLCFPLGDSIKSEVKEISKAGGIKAADRDESQEICFIPDGDYATYIEHSRGKSPSGDFVDEEGNILGKHNGIIRYTLGQRKGLGVALGARAFVTDIDPVDNKITLSFSAKQSSKLLATGVVFSGMRVPREEVELELFAKVRYLAPAIRSRVVFHPDATATVELSQPARSVTPGQSVVFYDGDRIVAGGFISIIN